MAYRHSPRTNDPYNSRPDHPTFRPQHHHHHHSQPRYPVPVDHDWAKTQLVGILLAAILLWKYDSLYRLVSSLIYDPKGTATGLIEMVGFKLTNLGSQLSQTKVEWSPEQDDPQSSSQGKPVRRYKDILGSPVEAGTNYPGLLNAAGNLCYLNATLQSMASTPSLCAYLDSLLQSASLSSTPTPVASALLLTLTSLNTPSARPRSLRPIELAHALAAASDRNRRLMGSADQQDAHELWVMVRESVEDEAGRVDAARRAAANTGLAGLVGAGMGLGVGKMKRKARDNDPYLHLMSQRVKCLVCGYTRDVRHTVEELVGVIVPPVTHCSLAELLEEYTKMELISEYTCRACSLRATHAKLVAQRDRLAAPPAAEPAASTSSALGPARPNAFALPPEPVKKMSAARKERRRKAQRLVERVEAAIEAGDFEKELGEDVKVERVAGPAGKQVRFARTPDVLTFHLNRSSHFGHGGAFKNSARVNFPEYLDLSAFSDHPSTGPAPTDAPPRELYRLASLVEHYGSHSFGHYVAYRRRPPAPTPAALPSANVSPANQSQATIADAPPPVPEWLHVSDETVSTAHLNDALRANPFLIFYERVTEPVRVGGTVARVEHVAGEEAVSAAGETGAGAEAKAGRTVVPRVVQSWSFAAGLRGARAEPAGELNGTRLPQASVDSAN